MNGTYALLKFHFVAKVSLHFTYHAKERDPVEINDDNTVGGIIGLHDVPHVLLLVDKRPYHVLAGHTLLLKTGEVQVTNHLNIQDFIAPRAINGRGKTDRPS